ncbi:DinB family protein [Brevibacillus borstelensis]|uniref:DinB family protein n=1 Tax=Brevibacillus borstelensis TaxID=45462 RepID=UPI0030C5A514
MFQKADKRLQTEKFTEQLEFYCGVMGFGIEEVEGQQQLAFLTAPGGERILLAGAEKTDLSPYLTDVFDQPAPGQSMYLSAPSSFYEYRDRILAQMEGNAEWLETEWGWERLSVTDPDGYVITFWGGRNLSDEQIIRYYDEAPARLRKALEGLNDQELDLSRAPGKWSIRQIVLHMVDSDATSLAMVKFALAEPGRVFHGNAYDPDVWAAGLDYAHRSIQAEVELFCAIRSHIGGLLKHLPDALDRTVSLSSGHTVSVRQRIEPLMGHALHHIRQILETRKVHGV